MKPLLATQFDSRPSAATSTGGARATLAAATLGFFMVTLDAVILNVALPQVRADLGGGIRGLQWVVDGYTLMFAALLLSCGSLSDRLGSKRAFGIGVTAFCVSSAACGIAPNLATLVLFRFIQGSAAAALMPSSMALIGQAYPEPSKRIRAVSFWAMGGAAASSCGPLIGGLLASASWRWIFLVNVPVSLLALALLSRAARSPRHRVPFDRYGQISAVVAMSALTFAVIEIGGKGPKDPLVWAAIVLAAVSTIAFVTIEARIDHPMVPLELFRVRRSASAIAIGFAFMVGYYGMPFVMSLFLQQHRGLSPLSTGVVFLPMMLTALILNLGLPRAVHRVGARTVIMIGLISMTLGLAALAFSPTSTPFPIIAIVMMLVGVAGPGVAPQLVTVLLDAVPAHRAGSAGGVLNTSRQLGGALAIAVFGTLLSSGLGFVGGMRLSLVLAAATTFVSAVVGFRGLSQPSV